MLYYLPIHKIFVNKVFASVFFGLLVLIILPFSMTSASANSGLGYEDGAIIPQNAESSPLAQPIIDCAVDTGDIVGWDKDTGVGEVVPDGDAGKDLDIGLCVETVIAAKLTVRVKLTPRA